MRKTCNYYVVAVDIPKYICTLPLGLTLLRTGNCRNCRSTAIPLTTRDENVMAYMIHDEMS